jgi:hypothetical protein
VQVSGQSGPGHLAQIQSDVESVGRHGPSEPNGQIPQHLGTLDEFIII